MALGRTSSLRQRCMASLAPHSLVLPLSHPFVASSQFPNQLSPSISSTVRADLVSRINGFDQRTTDTKARGSVVWKSLISQVFAALKMLDKKYITVIEMSGR